MSKFLGTGIAIVTPFNSDLSVDYDTLQKLVDHNINNGLDYLVISGTTGESVTITKDEKQKIIRSIIEANDNRVPMVLGIGGNKTSEILKEIETTDLSEIDALLSVSPYYSKPTQEGIYQHFKALAEKSPKPIILYNVPGRTASNMSPATTLRLANDFEKIVAVKEAGNNMAQYLHLLRDKPEDFLIISGDDDLALGVVLAGGSGVISVLGQAVPKEFCQMIKLGLAGNSKEAYGLHFKLMDLTSLIFRENNPAGIKAVLSQLGYGNAAVRLPLVEATDTLKMGIKTALSELGYEV